ncbi:MAG: hypothetical protein CMO74_12650 [Verrucomicrobiales bacterium]|nr:hypothetical protein [Verrucomicrobiales bacterium]|tara:strand:- start:12952 stop:13398 length:447 start_codon:yes stop_codon:yes gene_type:complete
MKWLLMAGGVFGFAVCGQGAGAFSMACEVYYRASETRPLSQAKVLKQNILIPRGPIPEIARPPRVSEARFATMTLRLANHHNGSVVVDVVDNHTGKQISRHLWQFSREPGNIFGGTGQGFTGLIYVKHPGTSAEMQFFCKSAGKPLKR